MAEKCIITSDWEEYLNNFSKKLKKLDESIEIELIAPSVEEIEEAKAIKLIGISYDPKDKVLSVLCEDLDHLIHRPQEICVEEENAKIKTIKAIDENGLEHLIKFSKPLALV